MLSLVVCPVAQCSKNCISCEKWNVIVRNGTSPPCCTLEVSYADGRRRRWEKQRRCGVVVDAVAHEGVVRRGGRRGTLSYGKACEDAYDDES